MHPQQEKTHLLIGLYCDPSSQLIMCNSFNCGRFLSAEQCKQILQANLPISFQAYYLDGVSNKEVHFCTLALF